MTSIYGCTVAIDARLDGQSELYNGRSHSPAALDDVFSLLPKCWAGLIGGRRSSVFGVDLGCVRAYQYQSCEPSTVCGDHCGFNALLTRCCRRRGCDDDGVNRDFPNDRIGDCVIFRDWRMRCTLRRRRGA